MNQPWLQRLVWLVAALFVVTACEDDDPATTDDTSMGDTMEGDTTTGDTTEGDTMADSMEETITGDPSIAEIAAGDENFSTLLGALERVELDATLAGEGSFTVFAPTNQAFEDLGVDLTTLTDEQLTAVLLHHVVDGAVTSDNLPDRALSRAEFSLIINADASVTVNEATVTDADIMASNGVVHVVDTVMMPPDIIDLAGYAGLSSLATALTDAELVTTIRDAEDITVFAPTNAAFDNADLTGFDADEVLTHHVVAAVATSDNLPTAPVDSLAGFSLIVNAEAGADVTINEATIAAVDFRATNGVVHVIDTVMLPPNIVDLAGYAGLTELATALDNEGLVTTIEEADGITVFAPTNTAFDNADLTGFDAAEVLTHHVVAAVAPSDNLPTEPVDSLAGFSLIVASDTDVTVNEATVVLADVKGTNGIVHVIDTVMLPPNIVDLAGYAGLSELATALDSATLVETLRGEGPFTVFAPNNTAFGDADLTGFEAADVLLYHVISGAAVESSAVADGFVNTALTNTWGNNVSALLDTTSGVTINGAAVVLADVKATNGVVHVIDGVILPPTITDMVGIAGLTGLGGLVSTAADLPDSGGSVANALAGAGPLTVFAPDNTAIAAIPNAIGLTNDQKRDILLHHVVGGNAPVLSTDLETGTVTTLNGDITVTVDGANVTLEGSAGGTASPTAASLLDIHTTNGVVHVIDDVLLPFTL